MVLSDGYFGYISTLCITQKNISTKYAHVYKHFPCTAYFFAPFLYSTYFSAFLTRKVVIYAIITNKPIVKKLNFPIFILFAF